MPEKRTLEKARHDRRRGKAPSTQAGEFVREEIELSAMAYMAPDLRGRPLRSGYPKRGGLELPFLPPARNRRRGHDDHQRQNTPHTGDLPASGLARRSVR